MKALTSFLAVLALAAPLSSCAPSFDTPPDLQPLLQAYENPTAVVGEQIMSKYADKIAKAAEEIQDSEIFEEILQVIIEVQRELEMATDEDGNLVLDATCNDGTACADNADCPDGGTCGGGVVIPTPTGEIRVNYICPGWDERQFDPGYEADPDPENGRIVLTMTLDSGGIGRVVWGTADNCLYLVPGEGENFQASYDGGVALDLGDPVSPGEDIRKLIVTFLMEGDIGFDGDTYPINQSFRVRLENAAFLVILVDIGDPPLSKTFNYIFAVTVAQCVRDRNAPPNSPCTFGCSLEDSRCFDKDGNTLFSW
jgi:hypothetical protein